MDNQAANVDVATVGAFYMPITLGAYTAWQEKTLDIESLSCRFRQYLSIPVYISSCRKNAVVSGLCGEAAVRVNTRKHRINRMGKTHFSIIL